MRNIGLNAFDLLETNLNFFQSNYLRLPLEVTKTSRNSASIEDSK